MTRLRLGVVVVEEQPTFAATARYFDLLDHEQPDLEAYMAEVREFALNEYAPALLAGSTLSDERRRAQVTPLRLCGAHG